MESISFPMKMTIAAKWASFKSFRKTISETSSQVGLPRQAPSDSINSGCSSPRSLITSLIGRYQKFCVSRPPWSPGFFSSNTKLTFTSWTLSGFWSHEISSPNSRIKLALSVSPGFRLPPGNIKLLCRAHFLNFSRTESTTAETLPCSSIRAIIPKLERLRLYSFCLLPSTGSSSRVKPFVPKLLKEKYGISVDKCKVLRKNIPLLVRTESAKQAKRRNLTALRSFADKNLEEELKSAKTA